MTDKAVCEDLGISTRQFRRWHGEIAMLGQDAFPGHGHLGNISPADFEERSDGSFETVH